MNFFKPKPPIAPSKKMRKADVGDTIVFKTVNGMSAYYPHVGHSAVVLSVQLLRQAHRPSLRATYRVLCSCQTTLNPRANEFDVIEKK